MTKAIILAAGRGSRIRKYHKKPKGLIQFGDKKIAIIERLYKILKRKKIKKITIVTGYKSEMIKKTLGRKVTYIHSKNYKTTNNLQSLLKAKKEINGNIICVFADLIFDEKIINKILKLKKGDFHLVVDTGKVLRSTMRVEIKNKKFCGIGNHISVKKGQGNFIGISKFSNKGSKILRENLKYFSNNQKDYYTVVFNKMVRDGKKINYFDCRDYFWKEIDTYKDLYDMKQIIKQKKFIY